MVHVYHWKHGWIPLDAYATAIKMKMEKGSAHHLAIKHGAPGHTGHMEEDAHLSTLTKLQEQAHKAGPQSAAAVKFNQMLSQHQAEHGMAPNGSALKLAAQAHSGKPANVDDMVDKLHAAMTAQHGAKEKEAPSAPAKPQTSAEKLAAKATPASEPAHAVKPQTSAEKLAAKATQTNGVVTPAETAQILGPSPEPLNHEEMHATLAGLSSGQTAALRDYTGNAYEDINTPLRKGTEMDASSKATMEDMDAALASKPLPRPIKAWRSVSISAFKLGDVSQAHSIEGKIFNEKAFMSTAVEDQEFAGSGTKPKIHVQMEVPAGIGAIYLDPISKNKGEAELLLQRDLRYVITAVRKASDGQWLAKARILPPSAGSKLPKAA